MSHTAFRRIGLTGGIGSGKSTLAQLLVARGVDLIDADALSRQLTAAHGAAMGDERLEIDAVRGGGRHPGDEGERHVRPPLPDEILALDP